MKICLVSMSALRLSGIGRVVLNVGQELERQGHKVGYITGEGDCTGDILFISFRTRNAFTILQNVFKMYLFVRRYDALICYDVLPAGFLATIISFLTKKPLYLHCVGTYSLFSRSPIKNYFIKLVYAHARKKFVLSSIVKSSIEKSLPGFSLNDVPVIPPGVETDSFSVTEDKPSVVTGPYILTVGAIKSRKGHDLSIEAFGKIAKSYPDLKYVCIGQFDRNTEFARRLDKIIETYNIRERVLFREVDDVELRKLYSHAVFFVMTSRNTSEFIEGFGIVYLEAALCGVPSIGAFNTGAEDAIMHDATGILTESDVSSISQAMVGLLTDDEHRRIMGTAARERALQYSWKGIVARYLEQMNEVFPQTK